MFKNITKAKDYKAYKWLKGKWPVSGSPPRGTWKAEPNPSSHFSWQQVHIPGEGVGEVFRSGAGESLKPATCLVPHQATPHSLKPRMQWTLAHTHRSCWQLLMTCMHGCLEDYSQQSLTHSPDPPLNSHTQALQRAAYSGINSITVLIQQLQNNSKVTSNKICVGSILNVIKCDKGLKFSFNAAICLYWL